MHDFIALLNKVGVSIIGVDLNNTWHHDLANTGYNSTLTRLPCDINSLDNISQPSEHELPRGLTFPLSRVPKLGSENYAFITSSGPNAPGCIYQDSFISVAFVQVNPPRAMAAPTPSSSASLYSLVRTEYHQLQPKELLRQSPRVLLGVSLEAAALLKSSLEINTVFDLATSAVFNGATKIAGAGGDMT